MLALSESEASAAAAFASAAKVSADSVPDCSVSCARTVSVAVDSMLAAEPAAVLLQAQSAVAAISTASDE